MLNISAKIRKPKEKIANTELAGVLYGHDVKNESLKLNYKEFEKVYKEVGSSSLITLIIGTKKNPVLVYDIQRDPLTGDLLHADFYQTNVKEKIEAKIPLVFNGESEAVKNLNGTLIKDIRELEVKAFPQDLPKEIEVDISRLKTMDDIIMIKDLNITEGVEIMKDPNEIVVSVVAVENIEEELKNPIEEKVEEVEKVEGKKKKETEEEPK